MSLTPGSRLGPYEIVCAAGAGGMGEVYKARDSRLGRTVALKILPLDLAADARLRLRFEREAKAISALNHPHICTLHDLGRDRDIDYLVMEYCEGDTLAGRIATGPLPLEQLLQYGIQIADALARAHRQRIIHRDLKPSNVMVTKSGVKVLDFGLARIPTSSESHPERSTALHEVTAEGQVPGTTGYMAPELFQGAAADERSDIFALGIVLYEMATGRRAFEGTSRAGLIAAILERDPPPVSDLNADVPPRLERVIRLCLVKDPEERIQSAHDVLLELRAIANEPRPRPPERVRRTQAALALAMVLALAAVVWLAWSARHDSRPTVLPRKLAIALPPELPIGTYGNSPFAVSPDGQSIAFVALVGETLRLNLMSLADGSVRALVPGDSADNPVFSPDGRSIAYWEPSARKIKRVEISSGKRIDICDTGNLRGAAWSPDGSTIVFSPDAQAPLFRVPAAGGKPEAVTSLLEGEISHRRPHFLPDGRHVAFTVRGPAPGTDGNDHLAVVSLDTRKRTDLPVAGFDARFSGGQLLFATRRGLFAAAFDPARLRVTGPARPLGADVLREAFASFASFEVTPEGSLLYVPQLPRVPADIVRVDRGGVRTISKTSALFGAPDVSPDGRHVAVEVYRGEYRYDIWRCNLESGTCSPLTTNAHTGDGPLWSKDQKQIAYSCPGRTTRTLCIMSADGGPPLRRLSVEWFWPRVEDWSADGRFVLFSIQSAAQWDIWRWDLEKGDGTDALSPVVSTPNPVFGCTLSPDSQWLIYESQEEGTSQLYATTFPDGRRTLRLGVEGRSPKWSSDGKRLFFRDRNRLMDAPVTAGGEIALGDPRVLYDNLDAFVEIAMIAGTESFIAIKRVNKPPEPNHLILEEGFIARLRESSR